ncbi:MAG TPA: DsbA family protein [Tepidiformaceae bacterium]|nr:DsbA family protein [Tepidiformaceae bacterium]
MSNRQARREQSRTTTRPTRPKSTPPGKTPKRSGGGPDLLSMPFLAGATVLIVALAVILGVLISRGGTSSDAALVSAIQTSTTEIPANLANGTKLGKDDAKIKLVEYEDFQCPFCLAYTAQQEPTLIKEYVATGKMQITYKTYPLLGTESVKAGEAALCAADQNKFWPYHDKLFLVQAEAGQHSNEQRDVGRFSDSNLKQYAADLGLDTTKFNSCYDSNKYQDQVNSEYTEGKQLGISGTPGFVIDGTPLSGTPSTLDSWRQALDQIYAATPTPVGSTAAASGTPAAGTGTPAPSGSPAASPSAAVTTAPATATP